MQARPEDTHHKSSHATPGYGHLSFMSAGDTLTVGQKIRLARDAMGLSQPELGDLVGVRGQTVYRWEAGMAVPPLDRLTAVATVLKVPLSELLTDDEDVSDDDVDAPVVDDSPQELLRFVELGAAAARGNREALAGLNELAKERTRRLRAAERAEKKRG